MEVLIPILAILMIFSIPLIAIWTSYKLKMKKMEMDGGETSDQKELKRQMGNMLNENELLRERLKGLEQIVAGLPQVSKEDREKLKINIESNDLSLEEMEKQRILDDNNYKL